MSSTKLRSHAPLFALLLGLSGISVASEGSLVVGSVAGSLNATLGGQVILPRTTVFSGDELIVKDGIAIVAASQDTLMVFGRGTTASFRRAQRQTIVVLEQGKVTVSHPTGSQPLQLRVGPLSVSPSQTFSTQGEVAAIDGVTVVSAREGTLKVELAGNTVEVRSGKIATFRPQTLAAANPQGTHRAISRPHSVNAWEIAGTAAAGATIAISGATISRSDNARDLSKNATLAGSQAALGATAASTIFDLANQDSTAIGCGLNFLNSALNPGSPSPYTPVSGSC